MTGTDMCSLHVFLGSSRWISGPGHHQSGYIVHLVPGSKPAEAALAELFVLPDEGYGSRGGDLTTDVIVWSMLSSGHMASFDRKTCTPPINGPEAIAGKLEAWTRAAVQAGHGGQRRTRMFRLGRSLEHVRPRAQGADRLDQWRGGADRARGRQVRDAAPARSQRCLHQGL
jgi:hypothetical protein